MRELKLHPPGAGIRRLWDGISTVGAYPVPPTAPAPTFTAVADLLHAAPLRDAGRKDSTGARDSTVAWARHYRAQLRWTDLLLVLLSVILSASFVAASTALPLDRIALAMICISAVWLSTLCFWKTRDPRLIGVGAGEYKKVVHASAGALGWAAVLLLLLQTQGLGIMLLVTMPVGTVALLAGRWSWRLWLTRQRASGHYLSRVIVLGGPDDVNYVVNQIDKKSGAVFQVVGAALENTESEAAADRVGRNGVPVVAGLDNICEAVRTYGADAVIVAGPVTRGSSYLRELGWQLEESSVELVVALSLTNVAGPRIQMRPVEGLPLMHVDLPQFVGYKHLLKRVVDVAVSSTALLVLLPVFAVLALLIRRDSAGPVIFRQGRVCRDGKTFQMYKFRSMVETAEEELEQLLHRNEGSGPLFKLREDPRVTKVGAWMRRYSVDELPQFINVLKGQMSLVGPRPPLPSEVAGYDGPTHRRLYIKPGVTGLWQVNGRSDLSWEESVRLDLYYVENWSLTGDIMIMWRTFKVMLRPAGAGAY